MIHFGVIFALWLHGLFWGAGLASLITPRRWKAFWPVWMPLCGWTLQSAAVWACAHLINAGTDTYAWAIEWIPLTLLGAGLLAHGPGRWLGALRRFGGIWLLSTLLLALLALPLSLSSKGLTSISLGSCDAADYAAGARVFQDFGRMDRSGFLGQKEVVRVMSADNVPEFWLRLNHFTPSALIAQNGSILSCRPHQLTSLFTASILAASLPLVFWLARALFRLNWGPALGITALFGISPLSWYAVAHVAPAQMLAAQGITALGIAGVMAWRSTGQTWQKAWAWTGLLINACGLLLGSYNFILLVAFVPALGYVLLENLPRPNLRRLCIWVGLMAFSLATAGLFFWGRVTGLVERFLLFRQYDFGWKIPAQSPAGWLGMVSDTELNGLPPLLRILMAMLVVVLGACLYLREDKRDSFRLPLAAAFFLPTIAGYAFLEFRAELMGTNASYDAYKILSVFYPGILCTLALPLLLLRAERPYRILTWTAAFAVFGLNAWGTGLFISKLSHPPLRVNQALVDLRQVDKLGSVGSINMVIDNFWDRLWANDFLLRHEQYFLTHTYEGRLPGSLKGEWDLNSSLARLTLPNPADSFRVGNYFTLTRTAAKDFVRVYMGQGWHAPEGSGSNRWIWSNGEGEIIIINPHPYPIALEGTLFLRAYSERVLSVEQDLDFLGSINVGKTPAKWPLASFVAQPGRSVLLLRTRDTPPEMPTADARRLGVCLFDLEVHPSVKQVPPAQDKALASPQ